MEIQPFYGGLILPVPKCSTDGQAHSGRNSPEVGVGTTRRRGGFAGRGVSRVKLLSGLEVTKRRRGLCQPDGGLPFVSGRSK